VGLNARREAFCYEYTVDRNGTQAAIRAGYSQQSAQAQASQILAILEIQFFIAEIDAGIRKRLIFGKEDTIRGLMRIADVDTRELYDEFGHLKPIHELSEAVAKSIDGIEVVTSSDREHVFQTTSKIKMTNRMAALKELGKHFNIYEDHQNAGAEQMIVNFSGKFQDV